MREGVTMNENEVRIVVKADSIFLKNYWRIAGISFAALAVLVLVAGMFFASSKVPYPKDQRLEFPAEQYYSAGERYAQSSGATLLDKAFFNKKIMAMLEQGIPYDPVRQLVADANRDLRDKLVVVRRGPSVGGNFEVLYGQYKTKFENEAIELAEKLRLSPYTSRYEVRNALENVRRQQNGLEAIRTFLMEFSLQCELAGLPFTDSHPDVQLICGYLANLSRDLTVQLRDAAPVIDSGFLAKLGIPADSVEDIDFAQEQKIWQGVVAQAKEKHSRSAISVREQIDRQVRQKREAARNAFYTRWLGFLVMVFSTLCTFLALKRYSRIIRRKGLPKKSTFETYFATNVTSLVLRWVALIIVFIGMVELWGFLLLQLIQNAAAIPLLPLFDTIAGFALRPISGLIRLLAAGQFIMVIFYSLLAPLALGVFVVIQSWLVLLLSEYACFISSAYHVLYKLAHPGAEHVSRPLQGD